MEKSKKTLRDYVDGANAILKAGEVGSKETLLKALPILIDGLKSVERFSRILEKDKRIFTKLMASCCDYGDNHVKCFDAAPKQVRRDGTTAGDVIGKDEETGTDIRYRMISGFDGYRRAGGGELTQRFLNGLPQGCSIRA